MNINSIDFIRKSYNMIVLYPDLLGSIQRQIPKLTTIRLHRN